MTFFGQTLGLELAEVFASGGSVLLEWRAQRLSLHLARVDLEDLLDAPARLQAAHAVPLDFQESPPRNR